MFDTQTKNQISKIYKDALIDEVVKDFTKRGWSVLDSRGRHIRDTFFVLFDSKGIRIKSEHPLFREWLKYQISKKNNWVLLDSESSISIPISKSGDTFSFKSLPIATQNRWIYPGMAKSNILDKALTKAHAKILDIFIPSIIRELL